MSHDDISYELRNLINKLIDDKVKEIINNRGIETTYNGIVESVSGDTAYEQKASVIITNDDNPIEDVRNLSGELLTTGNSVIIYAPRGKLSNAYIGVKCKF